MLMPIRPKYVYDANIVDELTGKTFVRVTFRSMLGRKEHVDMPRSTFLDLRSLKKTLSDANAAFDKVPGKTNRALVALQQSEPRRHCFRAAQVGWGLDGRSFVLPSCVIGDADLLPPVLVGCQPSTAGDQRGNLADWKARVAAPFRHSSAGIIILSAPFAAPLLQLFRFPTIGLNLYGTAKVSKTQLCQAAYSAQGRADVLPRYDATPAGRVALAREHDDMMLPLDEAALASGTTAELNEFARAGIFNLSAKQDKRRHRNFSQEANLDFLTVWVATGERSFDELARCAGVSRDAGELARCLDIAASLDGHTLFDFLPSDVSPGRRRRWESTLQERLPHALAENFGVAMPAYLA